MIKYRLETKKELTEVYAFTVELSAETTAAFENRSISLKKFIVETIIKPFHPELDQNCRLRCIYNDDRKVSAVEVYKLEPTDYTYILEVTEEQ